MTKLLSDYSQLLSPYRDLSFTPDTDPDFQTIFVNQGKNHRVTFY